MADTFDTSTAAGRLRILWGATADPQLAMGADEVADVETVLAEHAAMTDELKQAQVARISRGFLAQAYANGWHDAIAAYRAPGWTEREAGWRKYIAEVDAFVASKVPGAAERRDARDNLCGEYSRPGLGGVLGPCTKAPSHGGEWHADASGATWEPARIAELDAREATEPGR